RTSWYVRWFFWSWEILERFRGSYSWEREERRRQVERGTNLCAFMRVILVWTPLVLLLHVVVAAAVLATATILPATLWSVGGYARVLGFMSLGAVGAGIILLGLSTGLDLLARRRAAATHKKAARVTRPRKPQPPGFLRVVLEWVKA